MLFSPSNVNDCLVPPNPKKFTNQHTYCLSPITDLTPPLVVLNNFSQAEDSHVKLMRVTFQHMFPTINIKTVRLSECRRVALFHLMEDGTVELRHFAIKAAPVGVSKSVRRILHAKIPDLSRLEVSIRLGHCHCHLSGVLL